MISLVAFLSAITLVAAQADEPENKYPGIFGFVDKITKGASAGCSNKWISGPYIEQLFCGELVPQQYLDQFAFGIDFGPETKWCKALACAYRTMGCRDPTYRIEAKIIMATNMAESCGETFVGLDAESCTKIANFIAPPPAQAPPPMMTSGKKRALGELSNDEIVSLHAALAAVEHYRPGTEGVAAFAAALPPLRKRAELEISDYLQVCSPFIATGLQLLEQNVNLPFSFAELLGPCGSICNYALCGLNIVCHTVAEERLRQVNGFRAGAACGALTCADWVEAPPSVCETMNVQCPVSDTHYTIENCPPPMQIVNPTKTTLQDCCQQCTNKCAQTICRQETCPEPQWPRCSPYRFERYDAYDCCPQCVDRCAVQVANGACANEPTSCPAGKQLGIPNPDSCCLACLDNPCNGVACPQGTPTSAAACGAGELFQDNSQSASSCGDCCPKCVPDPAVSHMEVSASAVELAAAAGIAAAAATL